MHVIVSKLDGTLLELEVLLDDKVFAIKLEIARRWNTPTSLQKLISESRLVDDEEQVRDLPHNGSLLQLTYAVSFDSVIQTLESGVVRDDDKLTALSTLKGIGKTANSPFVVQAICNLLLSGDSLETMHVGCTDVVAKAALQTLPYIVDKCNPMAIQTVLVCMAEESSLEVMSAAADILPLLTERGHSQTIYALVTSVNIQPQIILNVLRLIAYKDDPNAIDVAVIFLDNGLVHLPSQGLSDVAPLIEKGNPVIIACLARLLSDHDDGWTNAWKLEVMQLLRQLAQKGDPVVVRAFAQCARRNRNRRRETGQKTALRMLPKVAYKGDAVATSAVIAGITEVNFVNHDALLVLPEIVNQGNILALNAVAALFHLPKDVTLQYFFIRPHLGRCEAAIMREAAIQALPLIAQKSDPTAISTIVAAIRGADWEVRRAALQVLPQIASRYDVPFSTVFPCLLDRSNSVKLQAVVALTKMKYRSAVVLGCVLCTLVGRAVVGFKRR